MNYCAVTEAFDNSLRQQMSEYDKNNKSNNKNNDNNIIPPDAFDNYSDIDIQNHFNNNINQYHTMVPAFFTAQGDYTNKGPYFGTSINELKQNIPEESDNLSLLDSNFSEDSNISIKIPKKLDHGYCINKMVNSLMDDSDTISLASSQNDDVYKHVKTCKYCKTKINEKMRNYYKPVETFKQDDKKEYLNINNLGYDLKELLIIILAGIILIFVLDLLVKIGKKMNK
jgi:hypothetical protein